MRIVYVYHSLAIWGGVERVWVEKMNYLARSYGFDIYIITYNQGNHSIPYCLDERVHHLDLGVCTHKKYSFHWFCRIWANFYYQRLLDVRLFDSVKILAPDIIVTTVSGEMVNLWKKIDKTPILVETHRGYKNDLLEMKWWHIFNYFSIKNYLKNVDVIVSLTEKDVEKWGKKYRRVCMIPNIVNLNSTGHYSKVIEKHIIFVGRFDKQKGIPELLSVWRIVHAKHPEWQLDMYGEGPYKQKLLRLFDFKQYNINVFDPVSDIHSRYINSSILVLTSEYEPFGLVISEAMSCGIPVVSFEGDGPCSIITDGKDGYIVRNRNIQTFADKLCLLMEDEQMRIRMGRTAIESSKRFSPEKVMPKWKNLFESIVNHK